MGGKSSAQPVSTAPPPAPNIDYGALMASMAIPQAPSGPSAEEINAKAQEREDKRLKTEGLNSRDSLYSEYLDAGGAATDYVNNLIKGEQANADLLGIEYNITDESKQARIDDQFASIWGEGAQTELEALFTEWGNPEGFEAFLYNRGDAGNSTTDTKDTKTDTTATTKTVPKTLATAGMNLLVEDENLVSILGGA